MLAIAGAARAGRNLETGPFTLPELTSAEALEQLVALAAEQETGTSA